MTTGHPENPRNPGPRIGPAKRILDALVSRGLLRPEDSRRSLDELIGDGIVSESDAARVRAEVFGLEFVEVLPESPDASQPASRIPRRKLERYGAVPVSGGEGSGAVVVAVYDPFRPNALSDLKLIFGVRTKFIVAPKPEVDLARQRLFAGSDQPPHSGGEDSVIALMGDLLSGAVSGRASDVHLEPEPSGALRVRFRVDGVLLDADSVPATLAGPLITRIKVLASLDIAERRLPQDGRLTFSHVGKDVDLRVATLPTGSGEGVVLRILDRNSVALDLSSLGFSGRDLSLLGEVLARPHGAVLVTGPTGSGKSTTLYSALVTLNSPERKIVTIEDPVEYRLPGVTQVQVNARAGLTFASGLRSILRADPDVLMVGEIRDRETARTAIEASLTGHLVLATLHTGDAPSALSRLTDMGVEPYLSASSISFVIAQRLARKLCKECRIPLETPPKEVSYPAEATFFRPVGCDACGQTGFFGRIGLYEMMPVSEEVSALVVARSSARGIRAAAESAGMISLRDDGLAKAASGLTSVEEVIRTTS